MTARPSPDANERRLGVLERSMTCGKQASQQVGMPPSYHSVPDTQRANDSSPQP